MILISHRGNIDGPNPKRENTLEYIQEAIEAGYDVEIDFWSLDSQLWLGHDKPEHKVDWPDIETELDCEKLWFHCKNVEAILDLDYLYAGFHYFWHQEDDVTLTSKRYVWTYPGKTLIEGAIAVMPERFPDWDISKAGGICSDYISKYKESHD